VINSELGEVCYIKKCKKMIYAILRLGGLILDNNFSFSGKDATNYLEVFLQKLIDLGVDINNKGDFKKGIVALI